MSSFINIKKLSLGNKYSTWYASCKKAKVYAYLQQPHQKMRTILVLLPNFLHFNGVNFLATKFIKIEYLPTVFLVAKS
jgi:hypothetical protein